MNTLNPCSIPAEILADLDAVCSQVVSGGVQDDELLRRVRGRANESRAEAVQRFGVQEIGVEIIREMRESR